MARTDPGDIELSITRCPKCRGRVQPTVVSGPVLRLRRRLLPLGGVRSSMRGETCTECGYTLVFAEHPRRLLSGSDSAGDAGSDTA